MSVTNHPTWTKKTSCFQHKCFKTRQRSADRSQLHAEDVSVCIWSLMSWKQITSSSLRISVLLWSKIINCNLTNRRFAHLYCLPNSFLNGSKACWAAYMASLTAFGPHAHCKRAEQLNLMNDRKGMRAKDVKMCGKLYSMSVAVTLKQRRWIDMDARMK